MKVIIQLTTLFFICLILSQCKKIPARQVIELELVTVNGDSSFNNIDFELEYNQSATLFFEYNSNAPLKFADYKLLTWLRKDSINFKTEDISILPKQGATKGEFSLTFLPSDYFSPPSNNKIINSRTLQIDWINNDDIYKGLKINFKIK